MPNRERLDGPLIHGDRLDKRLIDFLHRIDAGQQTATATAVAAQQTAASASAGNSGDALLAAMYGTNGVQVLGSIASGVEIRGPGQANVMARISLGF